MSYTKADAVKEINKTIHKRLPNEIREIRETDSIKQQNRMLKKKRLLEKLKKSMVNPGWKDKKIRAYRAEPCVQVFIGYKPSG